jgi:hypothetical protein
MRFWRRFAGAHLVRDHCRIKTIADKVRSYNRIFTLLGFMQVLTPACRNASCALSLPNQHNRGQGLLLQQEILQ